jgi:hypothetical protein
MVGGQPRQIVLQTLSQKNPSQKMISRCRPWVQIPVSQKKSLQEGEKEERAWLRGEGQVCVGRVSAVVQLQGWGLTVASQEPREHGKVEPKSSSDGRRSKPPPSLSNTKI